MDKHKRLFDLLPEDKRPKGLWLAGDSRPSHQSCVNIEHAAMVWLVRELKCLVGFEGVWYIDSGYVDKYGDRKCFEGDTLIDALLAAAEHAGEGEK